MHRLPRIAGMTFVVACFQMASLAAAQSPTQSSATQSLTDNDGGWPRSYARQVEKIGEQSVIVYQPQVDSWINYRQIVFRCAMAVHRGDNIEPIFGVVEAQATTRVNEDSRLVLIEKPELTFRFPNVDAATAAECETLAREVLPNRESMEVALDRVLACIDAPDTRQREVEVSLDPPTIFASRRPAILVMFMGKPLFEPIPGCSLYFAANCNWDMIALADAGPYYLLIDESWMTATDIPKGPWQVARRMPEALNSLPSDDQWKSVRAAIPGKVMEKAPAVFVSDRPAEIIVTDGSPALTPVPGVRLMAVNNTDATLFKHTGDEQFYFLAAGRWFRAKSLDGPWSAATKNLPPDFKQIPRDSEWGYVSASVAGTDEAADAVMLASVPRRATVNRNELTLDVKYDGPPKFEPIEDTTLQCATNTTESVFLCDGRYYCCHEVVWFDAAAPTGPWAVCTSVPDTIYGIPPTHPDHNVTYARICGASGDDVEVGYTSGYDNVLVTAGVLALGAGVLAAAIASDADWNVRVHGGFGSGWYSYGSGAYYDPYQGVYCRGGREYGPYAGAGGAAAWNPATGSWGRRGAAYGPNGIVAGRQGYNAYTNTYGAQIGGANRYGTWSRGVVSRDDQWVAGGRQSGARGSAGWMRTSEGSGAMTIDSRRGGQTTVARNRDGDLYVGHNGNVYRRDDNGGWQERSGNGWQRAKDAARAATASAPPGRDSLEWQAKARQRGNAATRRAGSNAGPRRGGGGRGR